MSTAEVDVAEEGTPPRRGRSRQRERAIVQVAAGAAAVAAVFAGAEPTGTAIVDPLLTGAFAALVTLAAARSRRWPLFALPAGALVLASGWVLAPALASVVPLAISARQRARPRVWGALTGAIAVQAVLRGSDLGFHGSPTLIAAAATLPVLVSGYRRLRRRRRREVRRVALALAGIVALVTLGYGALLLVVAGDVQEASADARAGLSATRGGDTEQATARFGEAADAFGRVDGLLNGWWTAPARAVPVLAQHARAIGAATGEGRDLAETAGETVTAADYQRLRYTGGELDLAAVSEVGEPLDRTLSALTNTRTSIEETSSPWLLPPLADGLEELDAEVAEAAEEADLAVDVVAVAPRVLGADGPKRYFVAFLTPSELRGGGGFMGSWAEIQADQGRITLTRSGPTSDLMPLDGRPLPSLDPPEEYEARYGRYRPEYFVGDFAFSPHLPYDAEVISQIYPQTGGAQIDGVITIDPIALAALLELTGPIEAPLFGTTLTADNAADFLLRDNYVQFQDNDSQNAALSELVELTFDRLTGADLPAPRTLGDVLSPVVRSGHLRLWSPNEGVQAVFRRIGATGELPEAQPDRDFLAVAGQNSSNNKIDYYLRREIDYRVRIGDDGGVQATARITVHNDAPLDQGLPPYVIANQQGDPLGSNRMLVSVYSPHLLDEARVDGEKVTMESGREVGHRVYTRELLVPAGDTVVLELDLSGRLSEDGAYRLDLAPQPVVNPDILTLRVDRGDARPDERGPLDLAQQRSIEVDG